MKSARKVGVDLECRRASPKIAFIMSIYISDTVDQVINAIGSLSDQTYGHVGIFLYLDGPVDHEVERCVREHAQKEDTIFLYSNEKNKGLAHALNFLINKVVAMNSYQYIARMDADDYSLPERAATQVAYMEKNPSIALSGSFCEEFGDGFKNTIRELPTSHDSLKQRAIARSPFIHPTVIFRTEIFATGGGNYPIVDRGEDLELFRSLICMGYRLANIPEVLLHFRVDNETIARRKAHGSLKELSYGLSFMLRSQQATLGNVLRILGRFAYKNLPPRLMWFFWQSLR